MERSHDDGARRRSRFLRAIYALCLLGATCVHWAALYRHGLHWDYGGVPGASATFWTALAFLDPATIVLLLARPNAGLVATAAIIVADVIHNLWILARSSPSLLQALAVSPRVIEQIAFLIFVAITIPLAWAPSRQGAS